MSWQDVLDRAIQVAADPPMKRGQHVSSAQVYWPHIVELREAIDQLGYGREWRDLCERRHR